MSSVVISTIIFISIIFALNCNYIDTSTPNIRKKKTSKTARTCGLVKISYKTGTVYELKKIRYKIEMYPYPC